MPSHPYNRAHASSPRPSPISSQPTPPRAADFEAVRALAAADMHAVDALIRDRLTSDVVLINQVAEHIITSGGKRLRPMLHVLAAARRRLRGR